MPPTPVPIMFLPLRSSVTLRCSCTSHLSPTAQVGRVSMIMSPCQLNKAIIPISYTNLSIFQDVLKGRIDFFALHHIFVPARTLRSRQSSHCLTCKQAGRACDASSLGMPAPEARRPAFWRLRSEARTAVACHNSSDLKNCYITI